jgi:hypothetical protein
MESSCTSKAEIRHNVTTNVLVIQEATLFEEAKKMIIGRWARTILTL